jgi:hypothetical protein
MKQKIAPQSPKGRREKFFPFLGKDQKGKSFATLRISIGLLAGVPLNNPAFLGIVQNKALCDP